MRKIVNFFKIINGYLDLCEEAEYNPSKVRDVIKAAAIRNGETDRTANRHSVIVLCMCRVTYWAEVLLMFGALFVFIFLMALMGS